MKKVITYIALLAILMVAPFFIESVIAQPPPPEPADIPIDGGLGILLAAGMAYGAKRLTKKKNESIEE